MLLQAAHKRVSQFVGDDRLVGDLAQRHDRVLIVVAIDAQLRPGGDVAAALRRQHDQLEPVRDLLDAVFDGDASHYSSSPVLCDEAGRKYMYSTLRNSRIFKEVRLKIGRAH